MDAYNIINTAKEDLHFVYRLFDEAIKYQKRNNYPDWEGYDRDVLRQDILDKMQYKIVINDSIACIFSIRFSDKIIWRDRDKNDAIYLHRIAVNPGFKGQKQFQKILNWSIKYAQETGRTYIRMDTWANNPTIIDYYKSFGFQFIENFITPDTPELPLHNRNSALALLEYRVKE
jgi:ribosomal protein S18 acetylase RimI-like enzyme